MTNKQFYTNLMTEARIALREIGSSHFICHCPSVKNGSILHKVAMVIAKMTNNEETISEYGRGLAIQNIWDKTENMTNVELRRRLLQLIVGYCKYKLIKIKSK